MVQAAQLLASHGFNLDVYSFTNWSELAREGHDGLQRPMTGDASAPMPFIEQQLQGSADPIIAATDFVCAVPQSVRDYIRDGRRYLTLGTLGIPMCGPCPMAAAPGVPL